MSEDDNKKLDGLNSVWRTCNKIRDAILKIGLNLWETFHQQDPNQNNLISESKFVNIFGQQLRGTLGLSEQEVTELTDYFRVQDGRIAYVQFCSVIHNSAGENKPKQDWVTGLEWEDPMHKNRLSVTENRQLCILMMKIAQSVRLRELVLRPYFQDYELVAQNVGVVTFSHFARVLKFLGLMLSAYDYMLLVKRFIKDSYTVNYVGFVEEIEKIVQYMDRYRLIDFSDDVVANFPGKFIDAELPKLPRPEVGTVNIGEVYGKQSSDHPVLRKKRTTLATEKLVQRIMKFVHDNQLRVQDNFQMFDPLRSGYVTRAQFIRGLDSMGLSSLRRLYLSDVDIENITDLYADVLDVKRVDWKTFERNMEQVFTESGLDKKPFTIVESPPHKIASMPPMGQADWQAQPTDIRDRCEDAVFKVKARIQKRGLFLEPFFRDLDKINIAHVTKNQERSILLSNGILLSEEELYALESRYNDDMGFHYMRFLADTDPKNLGPSKVNEFIKRSELVNRMANIPLPAMSEAKDIVQVVAKVKGIVARQQIRVAEFMEGYDTHRELCIPESDFRRGLDAANVKIAVSEVDQLCTAFKSPLRSGRIDYKRFCQMIDEFGYQVGLERAPLIVPMQHITTHDGPENFLNFEERTIASKALETLAKYPDQVSNLRSLFQDYDRVNCGTLSMNHFLRALTTRGLHTAISTREFQLVCKCFGRERGGRLEVDYRTFLRNVATLNETIIRYPF